ncbi:hypothetical protein ACT1UH_02395 [Mycoplasma sp. 332]|uniref:hypothetical protein n=1 Tax=Mycoplasma sp. 332 TaxID=3458236 RepID=UPI004036004F
MKTKEMIKKVTKITVGLSLGLVIPITSISCDNKKAPDQAKPKIQKKNIQKPVSGKINYVAIGDDYAAGNNNSFNAHSNNFFSKEDNEVYGISYASYLANSISLINDDETILNRYENLGLSYSTTDAWLHLLKPTNTSNLNEFNEVINLNKKLGLYNANLNSEKVISNIKESNFITISLGFNDIFKKDEILSLVLRQFKDKKEENQFIVGYNKIISARIAQLSKNYTEIVREIKQINPNININLIGYSAPLIHTINIQGNFQNNVLKTTTDLLNKTISNIADSESLNYYSFSSENSIYENAEQFSTDYLSIFPSVNGYKKLAQDIFAKMSTNITEYNSLFNNNEFSNHNKAISFIKKATTIKSLIFGVVGNNVDTFKKPYPFEKNSKNSSLIASESSNVFAQTVLAEFSSKIKMLNNEQLKTFIDNVLSIIGINDKEAKTWFNELINSLISKHKNNLIVSLFEQLFDSVYVQHFLNKANIKVSQLLAKKSPQNTLTSEIRKILTQEFQDKNSIYLILKSVLNSNYLSKIENKVFIRQNLASLIKILFSNKSIKQLFPQELLLLWDKKTMDKNIVVKFDNLVNKAVDNLLSKSELYFANTNFDGFINDILRDSKKEIISLFQAIVDWLTKDKGSLKKIIDKIATSLKNVYRVPQERLDDIKYFIQTTVENLKDFKYSYELLDLFVETTLDSYKDNKLLDTHSFIKAFVKGLLFNTKDANKNNRVFFALISNVPRTHNIDLNKYYNGIKYLGVGLVQAENIINSNNISNLLDDQTREAMLTLLRNIANNSDNILNITGKNYIKDLFSLLIDDITAKGSLFNQILDRLGDYVVIHPLINFIKKQGYEKQILSANPEFNNIEEFVKSSYSSLYKSVNNKIIIDKLKFLVNDIVDNGKLYDKSSLFAFVVSTLKRVQENGLITLVETLLQQISSKENTKLLVNVLTSYINSSLNVKLTNVEKELIETYIQSILRNIKDSNLFKHFIDNFKKITKKIDISKIDTFDKLGLYLKEELSNLLIESTNPGAIQMFLDFLSLKNTKEKDGFNKFINVLSIFLKNENNVDFILDKLNLKKIVADIPKKIDFAKLPQNVRDDVKGLLNNVLALIIKKWDDKINPKIKELIKNSVSNEKIKNVKNLNELFFLLINENKEFLKEFILDIINNVILVNQQSEQKTVDIVVYLISTQINYKKLSVSEQGNIKSIVKKAIAFVKDKKIFGPLVESLLNTMTSNIKKFGIDFNKYDWAKIVDFIDDLDIIKIVEASEDFFINKISKDELKTLLKTLLLNAMHLFALNDKPTNDESTASSLQEPTKKTIPNINVEKILGIVQKILNKLSSENKKELIPYLVDAIYDLKENEGFKKFLSDLLSKSLKNGNQTVIKEILNNKGDYSLLASLIINKSYSLLLNEENKQGLVLILNSLFADDKPIVLDANKLAIKLFKNVKTNNLLNFIKTNLDRILGDEELLDVIARYLISLVKQQVNIKFSGNEDLIVLNYLKSLLKSIPNSSLIHKLKKNLEEKLSELTDTSSYIDFQKKLSDALKQTFSFNKENIEQIFDFLIIKQDKKALGEKKLVETLKVLLGKKEFLEFILKNINPKQLINNMFDNINLSNLNLGEHSKGALTSIIKDTKDLINLKYNDLVSQNINEIIEKLLLEDVLRNVDSFEGWFKNFFIVNEDWIIKKVDLILNDILLSKESEQLKQSIANFLVEFVAEKLNGIEFKNGQKESLKAIFNKAINFLPDLNISNAITKSAIKLLVKNINQYQFNFEKYNFNSAFDFISIFNKINIDKLDQFLSGLDSHDLANIILLVINNFDKLELLFATPSVTLQEKSKNKTIVEFNKKEGIKININDIFRLIKVGFSILNASDRESIKKEIPSLVQKIRKSPKIKEYVKTKLDFLTNLILKVDSNARDFADKTKEKIIKFIFDKDDTKDLITNFINTLISLDQKSLENIHNINELIKKLLNLNKSSISDFIKKIVSNATSDEAYINSLVKFVLNAIHSELKFDSTSDEFENIANLGTRIIKNLGNKNIVSDIISKLFESLVDIDIIDSKGHFDQNILISKIISGLKKIDWKALFTSQNIEDMFKSLIGNNISKEQLVKEFSSLYHYLERNIPKLTNQINNQHTISNNTQNVLNPVISDEQKEFLKNIEGTIFNVLTGLNGSLDSSETVGKEAIIEVVHTIFKDQIKKIKWQEIKQDLIPKSELQTIVDKFVDKPILKTLISDVISDFLTKPKVQATNIGEIVTKTLEKVSQKLKDNVTKVLEAVVEDDDLMKIVIGHVLNYLKLENVTAEDISFIKELISAIFKELIKTDFYKRKVVKRTIDHIVGYSKNFSIFEPVKWLLDAIEKIKAGFSFNDLKIIASFVGETKAINGARLIKLINLLFGKSNLKDSVLYNGLRNINMNPDPTKRTNINTLLDFVSIGQLSNSTSTSNIQNDDPDNISPDLDALSLINEIFKMLSIEYYKNQNTQNNSFKVRSKTPEWQALYRFKVAIDYILFETFGRETDIAQRDVSQRKINLYTGVRSLLWEIQEGTNISAIPFLSSKFSGMQSYFTKDIDRRQFTNYAVSESGFWFVKSWTYFDDSNYGPESITYLITSSGYNDKEKGNLTRFKYKISEVGQAYEISKKEYILLTLKEGGYGKFMKLNNKRSNSSWSGLDKINPEDFY